jgi:hypothetical protein
MVPDVFEAICRDLAGHTCQRDRTVVAGLVPAPFLNTGVTSALNQSDGRVPIFRDCSYCRT